MEKLYYENPYQKEFTAEVIDVIEKDNEFHVVLDKTCFYPEGGGQPSDTGFIDTIPVTYVYEDNGNIYHVISKRPIKIHRVKCTIDWERRFDHMQQHLGQHILSASLVELFNANTVGFHLSKEYSSIDIDKFLSNEEIKRAEEMSNNIVLDNIHVDFLFPTNQELKKLPLRKALPKTDEQIRIVRIGDFDINACCGTHPSSTIEVQMIKIIKYEKYKNGMRIEFLCGKRAVQDYFKKYDIINQLSSKLSCNENDIFPQIQRLSEELSKANSENRILKAEVADYEVREMLANCESIGTVKILKSVYDNTDLKYINTLASKLTAYPNVIVLFGVKSEDKAQLIFMRSRDLKKINMNTLLKDAITLIDGKGGGSDFSAQGGGKNNNNLDSTLDYAFRKIKDTLS